MIIHYTSLVRPHRCKFVCCPREFGDIKEIKEVQKRATKLSIELQNLPITIYRKVNASKPLY